MLIFMPMSPGWVAPMLAVAGLDLGIFAPAGSAVIMRTAGRSHEMGPSVAFG
jgi:hypothetical protein